MQAALHEAFGVPENVAACGSSSLRIGDRMRAFGLSSAAGQVLNGRNGVVRSHEASGRVGMMFHGGSLKSLKAKNLHLKSAAPCPLRSSPVLEVAAASAKWHHRRNRHTQFVDLVGF